MITTTIIISSHFWGTNTKDSDLDLMTITTPTYEDFWNGICTSKHTINKEKGFDETIKDIRAFMKELRKGSLRCFEALYGDSYYDQLPISYAFEILKNQADILFDELRPVLYKSLTGELKSKIHSTDVTPKKDSDILKLYLIADTIRRGDNPFKYKGKLPLVKQVKEGQIKVNRKELEDLIFTFLDLPTEDFLCNINFTTITHLEEEIKEWLFITM